MTPNNHVNEDDFAPLRMEISKLFQKHADAQEVLEEISRIVGLGDNIEDLYILYASYLQKDITGILEAEQELEMLKKIDPEIQEILDYCGCDAATEKIIRYNLFQDFLTNKFLSKKPSSEIIIANIAPCMNMIKKWWLNIGKAEDIIDSSNRSEWFKVQLKKKALEQGPNVAIKRAKILNNKTKDSASSLKKSVEETYENANVELPKNWMDMPVDQLPHIPE